MKKITSADVVLTLCGLATFAILSPVAMALPLVSATASATLGGEDPITNSDSGTDESLASVVAGEYTGRGASDSSGRLAASAEFFGASGTIAEISGGATWDDTFDATAGTFANFDFFIPSASIGFEANNVSGLSGSYMVEILFNGVNVFSANANVETLVGTPSTENDLSLTQTGTVLNATFATDIAPGFGLPGAGYRFDPFNGSLDLTAIDGTNTITYSMSVVVKGLIGETSALASIGDPLNLSQQSAGVTLTIDPNITPVPEPASMLLLSFGLIGLAAFKRKFKKS